MPAYCVIGELWSESFLTFGYPVSALDRRFPPHTRKNLFEITNWPKSQIQTNNKEFALNQAPIEIFRWVPSHVPPPLPLRPPPGGWFQYRVFEPKNNKKCDSYTRMLRINPPIVYYSKKCKYTKNSGSLLNYCKKIPERFIIPGGTP